MQWDQGFARRKGEGLDLGATQKGSAAACMNMIPDSTKSRAAAGGSAAEPRPAIQASALHATLIVPPETYATAPMRAALRSASRPACSCRRGGSGEGRPRSRARWDLRQIPAALPVLRCSSHRAPACAGHSPCRGLLRKKPTPAAVAQPTYSDQVNVQGGLNGLQTFGAGAGGAVQPV